MSLVSEVAVVCALALHGRGIGIGLAKEEIRLAPVEVALDFPILAPSLGNPVASGDVGGGEFEFTAARGGEAASVGYRAAVQGPRGGAERLELVRPK
jgi:hypothetical protein